MLPVPIRRTLFFCLSIFLASCGSSEQITARESASRDNPEISTGIQSQDSIRFNELSAKDYMAVTANPYASRAAADILARGGSVIDAAVAVQAVLTLVEPQSSGIGGGGFILFYDGKRLHAVEGRETAPENIKENVFLNQEGQAIKWIDAVVGGRSVGVPGILAALHKLHKDHGRLDWGTLFEEAIKLSKEGFIVSPRLARLVKAKFNPGLYSLSPAKGYFYPGGDPIAAGTRLKNPALAASLTRIATLGVQDFYRGQLAKEIVEAVQTSAVAPGALSLTDLQTYEVKSRAPLCKMVSNYRVCGFGPPSSGGVAVLQQLLLLEPYSLEFDSTSGEPLLSTAHLMTQASRLAYADRDAYLADSDFVPVPVERLLSPQYIEMRRKLIDEGRDMGEASHGQIDEISPKAALSLSQKSTSHFNIVDRYGNALSLTSSIEMAFGSSVMVGGFLLNNQLTDFSFLPSKQNGEVANRVRAGKRPRSSMAPTIVFKNDEPYLLLGSPGGSNIINYVSQTLLAVLVGEVSLQKAITAGKISNRNSNTALEKDSSTANLASDLEKMGHSTKIRNLNSGLHGIIRIGEEWHSGVDPRREGKALGR